MNNKKIKPKLYDIGKSIGLEASDVDNATMDIRAILIMIGMAIAVLIIRVLASQIASPGGWYGATSINDFNMLRNIFRFF